MYLDLVVFAVFIFIYSTVAGAVERTWISGAIIFTAFGILNVESGLNDGICVPILFLFLALATGKVEEGGHWQLAMKLVVEEIGIGLAVGLLLTVRVSSLWAGLVPGGLQASCSLSLC